MGLRRKESLKASSGLTSGTSISLLVLVLLCLLLAPGCHPWTWHPAPEHTSRAPTGVWHQATHPSGHYARSCLPDSPEFCLLAWPAGVGGLLNPDAQNREHLLSAKPSCSPWHVRSPSHRCRLGFPGGRVTAFGLQDVCWGSRQVKGELGSDAW